MENQTDPLFLLYAVAAAQGVFFLSVLWFNRKNRDASWRYLWGMTAVFTLIFIDFSLTWSGYMEKVPHLMGMAQALPFLLGPLLVGYIRQKQSAPFSKKELLLHLAPFILFLAIQVPFFFRPSSEKLLGYNQLIVTEEYFFYPEYVAESWCKIFHWLAYLGWGWWLLKEMDGNPSRSRVSRMLGWLSAGAGLFLVHVFCLTFRLPFYALSYCLLVLLLGAMTFWFTLLLLKKQAPKSSADKYQKSTLTPAQLNADAARLRQIMETEKPYLQPGLSLHDLAEKMALSKHHLSQVLNQSMGVKFSDFVNEYRVEHAKSLLQADPGAKQTVLGIAYQSGFNAKNSFNAVFKKFTGMTPTAFRRSMK